MSYSAINNSTILPVEACRLACDICGIDMALFDPSNTLKQANARWLLSHGLELGSAAGTPGVRCWPADDANERIELLNRARTTGISIIYQEQRDGQRVETCIVPLSTADVMLISSSGGIDRTAWPTRLPKPELVGAIAQSANRVESLSKREREVFGMLASGMTIRKVAEQLGRSEKTIEGHRDAIYRKLNVNNRAEIAILAIEAGVMPAKRSSITSG